MSDLLFPLADLPMIITDRQPVDDWQTDTASAGNELRSTWSLTGRTKYTVKVDGVRSDTRFDFQRLLAHFQRHRGGLDSFLLFDAEDNTAADTSVQGGGHVFGIGDGATTLFQLQRRTLGAAFDKLPGVAGGTAGGPWRVSSGPRVNALLQSNDLSNAAWTKGTGVVATANASIAPDNLGAAAIVYSGGGSAGGARLSQAVVSAAGVRSVVSVDLRADTAPTVGLGTAAGIVTTVTLGASWARYYFPVTPAAGGDVGLVIYSPAGVNTAFRIYAWGAQSESDLGATGTPTARIATTSAAVQVNPAIWPLFSDGFWPVNDLTAPTSIFRLDYQGLVQLFPWARTNRCLQSQTFGNASWTKTNVTVGAAVAAPDGTTTALPLTGVTSPGGSLTQVVSGLVAGQAYDVSIWLRCAAGGTLTFGTTEGTGSVSITSAVQRFTRTFTAASTSTTFTLGTWSVGEIVECWGAQLELGQTAGSYIPTTTAIVSFTDYSLPGIGQVQMTAAPVAGAVLSWTGGYLIRVRFDAQGVPFSRIVDRMWSAGIQLISVKAPTQ